MAENSKISWTHHTFNPWIGCSKVSEGCRSCYAEQLMDIRWGKAKWGPNGTRNRTSIENWNLVLRIDKRAAKRGIRERIFCASLADIFEDHPAIQLETRMNLFRLIEQCKNLDWLLLTKRPENIPGFLPDCIFAGEGSWKSEFDSRFPHVMLGATVENQKCADERIPILCELPGKHFISAEPLLAPLDLSAYFGGEYATPMGSNPNYNFGIHWIIVGGESGKKCRPIDIDWARSIRDQCKSASVPFFMKQLGGYPNAKEELDDFPEDLRIREFPTNLTAVQSEG